MGFERLIARRLSQSSKGNFSSLILKIAIASIALSMAVMIITTTVITGFKNGVTSKVLDFWGHIHITDGNVGNSFEIIPIEKDTLLINSIEAIDQITYKRPPTIVEGPIVPKVETSIGGVNRVETYTIVPAIISSQNSFEGVLLKGFESDYDRSDIDKYVKSGSFIQFHSNKGSRDIVLSEQIAQRMSFGIGDAMIVSFIIDGESFKRKFTISGIYRTGLEEYDRRFALVDARTLQEVLGWSPSEVSGLEVYIDDIKDLRLLNEYIYFEQLPRNLYSESIQRKFYQIFEWLELQNINEDVLIMLMILVAIINMITAVLIFVLENTHTIGLLKSIGAKNWSIRRIFLYNAGEIIIKGMLIGNALAFVICFVQLKTGFMKLSEKEYYLDTVPIEFNWSMILLINIGTILITLAFLILPTVIVTRIDPVKALRFS